MNLFTESNHSLETGGGLPGVCRAMCTAWTCMRRPFISLNGGAGPPWACEQPGTGQSREVLAVGSGDGVVGAGCCGAEGGCLGVEAGDSIGVGAFLGRPFFPGTLGGGIGVGIAGEDDENNRSVRLCSTSTVNVSLYHASSDWSAISLAGGTTRKVWERIWVTEPNHTSLPSED